MTLQKLGTFLCTSFVLFNFAKSAFCISNGTSKFKKNTILTISVVRKT